MDRINLRERRYIIGVVLTWLVPFVLVSAMVAFDPVKRSVTPCYHQAVAQWSAGQSLYDQSGFYYFPQFALLFAPFHALPAPVGDILWRLVSMGLLLSGIGRLLRCWKWPDAQRALFYCSLLAIAPSLGALRNGQANFLFSALMVHTVVFLATARWTSASLCLVGLLALKPIGLVPILLAPVVYWRLLKTLPLLLIVFLGIPFLFGSFDYVLLQYHEFIDLLCSPSLTDVHRFADVNGLLRTLGIHLSGSLSKAMSFMAGLSTLSLWLVGAYKRQEPQRALLLLALTTIYLVLFNPMTETNSYVIIAPALAVYAVYCFQLERRVTIGRWLIFVVLSIAFFPEIFRSMDRNFGLWWHPSMALGLSGLLAVGILKNKVFLKPAADRRLG